MDGDHLSVPFNSGTHCTYEINIKRRLRGVDPVTLMQGLVLLE